MEVGLNFGVVFVGVVALSFGGRIYTGGRDYTSSFNGVALALFFLLSDEGISAGRAPWPQGSDISSRELDVEPEDTEDAPEAMGLQ